MRTITTSIEIERGEREVLVTVTGTYSRGGVGRRAHPMDRFAPPDDPEEMADITAYGPDGEVDLTERELETAEEALWKSLNSAEEDRADSIRARQNDADDRANYVHAQRAPQPAPTEENHDK